MKIYNYYKSLNIKDYHIDGEFLNEEEAKKSPLEKDVFLIPANATTIKPTLSKGYMPVFHKNKKIWENIENNRDKIVYNIDDYSKHTVTYLGAIKEGYTLKKPISKYCVFKNNQWIITKECKKKELKEIIKNEIRKIQEITYNNNQFQVDEESMFIINQNIIKLQNQNNLNDVIAWRTSANIKIDVNSKDLINILTIKSDKIQLLINRQFEIEEEINALDNDKVKDFKIHI